jgi:protein TonB
MTTQKRSPSKIGFIELGGSLAIHSGLLLLAALLIMKPPKVGVEAAPMTAEFQVLESPVVESSPSITSSQPVLAKEESLKTADSIQESSRLEDCLPLTVATNQADQIRPQKEVAQKEASQVEASQVVFPPPSTQRMERSETSTQPNPKHASRMSVPLKGSPDTLPAYLRNPPPAYPEPSRLAHEEGVVVLLVVVGDSGNPSEVRIQHSSGHGTLDQSAIQAVRGWKFQPATLAGMGVAMSVSIPVRFELH